MKNELKYISSGAYKTGGYAHEQICATAVAAELNYQYQELRWQTEYKGLPRWIVLWFKTFYHAGKTSVVLCTARLAWPVWLRTRLSGAKMILVLHNYDASDGKPKVYYGLLKLFLRSAASRSKRVHVLVISEYWKNYIKNIAPNCHNLGVFPNLFEIEKLQFYRDISSKSKGLIHLGQWSEKIDKKSYLLLIYELNKIGYAPYFSSNVVKEVEGFPISYFNVHEGYLKQMARSQVTIIINQVNEGWPRLVHESFLVGTQVITLNSGGIEPLIEQGNGYKVSTLEQILEIVQGDIKPINYQNLEYYTLNNKQLFAKQWMEQVQLNP